jgi:hypothetical protein
MDPVGGIPNERKSRLDIVFRMGPQKREGCSRPDSDNIPERRGKGCLEPEPKCLIGQR